MSIPIFMFGMERSGTTLLSVMVGSHPDIAVPFTTTGMWFSFNQKLKNSYNDLQTDLDMERLLDDVLAHERIKLWNTDLDKTRIQQSLQSADFGSLIAAVHAEYARQQNKSLWANIDIANLDNMHLLHKWFPNARYLHIIRDGRDVAVSHQTMPYGSGNIAECAQAWYRRITLNLRMGDILGPEQYLAIRYEDLVLYPQQTLENICVFFGANFSADMLNYPNHVNKNVPNEKRWLWPALDKPLDPKKINRWKTDMTENQQTVFAWNSGSLLKALNYSTVAPSSGRLGAYLLEAWYFLDRGGRFKRLLGKFGIHRRSSLERSAK